MLVLKGCVGLSLAFDSLAVLALPGLSGLRVWVLDCRASGVGRAAFHFLRIPDP